MQIISHRGYWNLAHEKNLMISFKHSFDLGFGTETDLRDYHEEIVISHDIANSSSLKLNEFFSVYKNYTDEMPLALNIKSDGLQFKLNQALLNYGITNYFVFDMSIPDTIEYLNQKIKFFSRQSEYEINPIFYNECTGIWLDSFNEIWYSINLIERHLLNGKKVAIVSPELHKRPVNPLWEFLKNGGINKLDNVLLCTDMPQEATSYFN